MRVIRLLCRAAALAATACVGIARAGETQPPAKVVGAFLEQYCLDCHDSTTKKGKRNLEAFQLPLKSVPNLISARELIDEIALKEMPPKKSDQPTAEERLAVLHALREGTSAARSVIESAGPHTAMRRLTSREYENTLATLFGRRVDTLGLTADFPKEKTSQHIDTIGQSLVTSGFLLDQYFQSANRLVETRLGKPIMKPQQWHFNGHFVQYEELQGPHKDVFNYGFLNIYEQPNTDTRQGGYGHIEDFLQGVPVSGLYDIEVVAQAMHRDTHYDPAIFGIDLSEPFILGIVPGDITKGHIHYPQPIEPLLASKTVPDEKLTPLEFRVWLEAGQTPRFIFPNGPYESRAAVVTINQRYNNEFKVKMTGSSVSRARILREGELPHIRISDIKIQGPVTEHSGSVEEVAVFGKDGFQADRAMDQLLAFAEKAYRRPLTDADREPIRAMYEKRLGEKATPRQAALDALKLILCSPSFLYLRETTEASAKALKAYDLASRLSYALWAAPPDDALLAAARSGKLTQEAELRKQVQRMLADERVTAFVHGFLDSWLNLRDLGSQPPPRETNRAYYAEDLPTSMKMEARLFFRDLLKNNGSAAEFLDSDYAFVDKKLAKLYDLPEQKTLRLADGFKKVSLNGNEHRGGLLGMAGVLTVSANGVETSPVTRGVWVSENILGIHPPPPPDDVPAIEADVSGATTVRERLARHRADKVCAECHHRIDPLGFSLESFDPIGRWRAAYPKPKQKDVPAPKVDASGEFTSGEIYEDFAGFKKVICATREDLFIRHLITEVLSYSTGRLMEPADSFVIDDIHEKVKKENLGLHTLLVECLTSAIFRSR
ncbi:Protein of unknown function DUF1588 [Chthoniobacter flavus Ellin428]|uniref:Cytochrome c domain-containing protein n=1 Tax=Chthoniobacter flavus Ellin428 TaxID=497964 RepID=B4D4I8_9BACT|nr:DUF1592 domain-containing protein [Chthoniobacter flavus]EDY18789.1 Protein of unknown function DUF1588 [Chthoniobacter flavus Ellin428]TCO82169.1 uncharacterized protein DUF1585 [Chthoniobacter flavus]